MLCSISGWSYTNETNKNTIAYAVISLVFLYILRSIRHRMFFFFLSVCLSISSAHHFKCIVCVPAAGLATATRANFVSPLEPRHVFIALSDTWRHFEMLRHSAVHSLRCQSEFDRQQIPMLNGWSHHRATAKHRFGSIRMCGVRLIVSRSHPQQQALVHAHVIVPTSAHCW